MPSIPRGLKPVVENYGIGAPDGVMRTDVAGGLPRYGLEWDRGVQQFRVTMILDTLKFSVWTTFFHHTIKKGSLAFDMPLDSGYGVQDHTVSIMPGTYAATPHGGGRAAMWTVSFSVEAESAAYGMSAADAAALLALYELEGPGSNPLLERIDIFANQDTLILGYTDALAPPAGPVPTIAVADWDGYMLQNSDTWTDTGIWNPGALTRGTYTGPTGTQYEQQIGIESPAKNPGSGAVAARITWAWPEGDLVSVSDIKSYPAILKGNKPGYYNTWVTPGGNTVRLPDGTDSTIYPSGPTPNSFFPLALPLTGSLHSTYARQHNITPTGRGHLTYDIWLQSSPTQGNGFAAPPITTEIMIPVDYWGSPPYGSYPSRNPSWYNHDAVIDGRLWHLYYAPAFNGQWVFIVFEPDAPLGDSATLDLKALINYAIAQGWTTAGVSPHGVAATHLVSVEFGVEPSHGTGDVTIYGYDVVQV